MKRTLNYCLIAMVALGLSLGSCKKKDDNDEDDSTEQAQMAADENQQNAESEAALDEVNDAVSATGLGKAVIVYGATIDTTSIAGKKIIIHYIGDNKEGTRTRSGTITAELTSGSHWKDAGAVITITFTNFKVTRHRDGKSITFNGTHVLTNVIGGRVWEISPVVHRLTGTMSVTFDDGTSRDWNVARKRTFTNTSGVLSVSIEGEGTQNGIGNLATWGTNRKGNAFYTQITKPVVFTTACPGSPVSGEKVHKGIAREITVTFGTDRNGDPVTSGTDCPYGAKIKWTNAAGKERTLVIQY